MRWSQVVDNFTVETALVVITKSGERQNCSIIIGIIPQLLTEWILFKNSIQYKAEPRKILNINFTDVLLHANEKNQIASLYRHIPLSLQM